jgi:amidase
VVLKDNVMLAGVSMMNGASYVPEIDATIVTRILDAGGTIVGKAHCEYFCASGGSHTNATGPVHNPHKMGYSAGGSSSGSAVLVALGEVETWRLAVIKVGRFVCRLHFRESMG